MLIDEIIELLASQQADLATALLKTKVLLRTLGETELTNWVSNELTGYPDDSEVPEYRVVTAHIKGTVVNLAYIHRNTNLPMMHLDDDMRDALSKLHLRQSIATLEELSKGERLGVPLAPELWSLFDAALDGNYHVQSARREIAPQELSGALLNIQSRLLDFMLELRDRLGSVSNDTEAKAASKSLDIGEIFRSAVIGDNATIIVGHNNRQTAQNRKGTDDVAALITALRGAGVADPEISALQHAIDEDAKDGGPSMSKRTGQWFTDLEPDPKAVALGLDG